MGVTGSQTNGRTVTGGKVWVGTRDQFLLAVFSTYTEMKWKSCRIYLQCHQLPNNKRLKSFESILTNDNSSCVLGV